MSQSFLLILCKDLKMCVMNTKLTLTIEQEVKKRAKKYAKDNNRSLSGIIENYLKTLTKEEKKGKAKKPDPVVKSLKGSFKMPKKDMDYNNELRDRLEKKYL